MSFRSDAHCSSGLLGFPLLTQSTRFGRYLYAVGGNREASYLSGINIDKTVLAVFVIMGLIYGVAGIMAAARLDAVVPSTGSFLELEAIAAAVIGGVSLSGGTGAVQGALIGSLLLTSIDNGMSLLNVSSFVQLYRRV